jgi:mono/diheme cytochrome c family protein
MMFRRVSGLQPDALVSPTRQRGKRRNPRWRVGLTVLLLVGCQQRMAVQPRIGPDEPSTFFADGRASRPLVAGTVARGHLHTDLHLFTGMRTRQGRDWTLPAAMVGEQNPLVAAAVATAEQANYVDTFPFPVTAEVLRHGQHRFMIYCVVCHDPLGEGQGKIVERGYTRPPSYHIERLRHVPVGHFFDVITNGYGSMPEYKQQVPVRDRWAIAAYIRALQLSQHFARGDLTEDMRAEWQQQEKARKERP